MADFQPRFVDLVRNYSSTVGTGAFVLGPAVNGFTGFGSALQTGDNFYYSAIGVDKPAEREVGRGTLLANGTISRSPIGGPATNFSSGTKSIALIAAAEWFSAVQAGAGSLPIVAASRAELAAASAQGLALLTEIGREGLFKFDGSNLGAKVAADLRQGVHVAPASDATGASGAWVRTYSGAANVRWFGAKGDNFTDDGPAFAAALNYLKAIAYQGFGYSSASPALFVPFGTYFLGTTTLDLSHTLIIEGESVGEAGGGATVLRWAANTTGIRVQRFNTSGASTTDSVTHQGGDASVISRLSLKGAYVGSEGEHHGVHLRARATIRDVHIRDFQGDGICILADGTSSTIQGNANNFEVSRVFVENCRNGIYVEGGDSNAGVIHSLSALACRQWGVRDRSFLGNSYSGCHTAANGVVANVTPTLVHLSGRLFYVKPGQAAAASTNSPPGSAGDNAFWGYARDGAPNPAMSIPTWTSGIGVREGGAYSTDSPSASHVLTNCYSEMDQAPSRLSQNTLVLNGLHAAGVSGCGRLTSRLGQLAAFPNFYTEGSITADGATHSFGPKTGTALDTGLFMESTNVINAISGRSWLGGVPQVDGTIQTFRGFGIDINGNGQWVRFRVNGSDVGTVQGDGLHVTGVGAFSGALSAANFSGSSSGVNSGDQTITLTGDVTGSGTGSFAATIGNSKVTYAKIQNVSATAKMLGRASAGAGVVEELGLAGGLTISGTNLTLGAITPTSVAATAAVTSSGATNGVGYAAGAGGAMTQATSKSTGVTLNKASGQVTTHNASLAAAAVVAFTVTNSAVAATDTINLNLASGNATAGTYRYWIEGIAAGSFKIVIENRSAGALGEALVFTFAVVKAVTA
ncbi:MAG TPA: hypothetical protein VF079_00625 [Sphingomicrobium sp.]